MTEKIEERDLLYDKYKKILEKIHHIEDEEDKLINELREKDITPKEMQRLEKLYKTYKETCVYYHGCVNEIIKLAECSSTTETDDRLK